jgi:hypothetical protein
MTGSTGADVPGLFIEYVLFFRGRFPQVVGGSCEPGLLPVTLYTQGVIASVLNQKKFPVLCVMRLMTGSTHKLTFCT